MSSGDFWTRRRQAVAEEARAEAQAEQAALAAEAEAALAQRPDDEILDDLGLEAPEDLQSPEAVRDFLASAVPQRLKTRALRRLWRLNPVLANLDGLVDYGEDFTDSATVIENLQTAYQVGKGMLAHVEEMARQAEADEAETDTEGSDDVAVEETDRAEPILTEAEIPDSEAQAADLPGTSVSLASETLLETPGEPDTAPLATPVPTRRMRFQFAAQS